MGFTAINVPSTTRAPPIDAFQAQGDTQSSTVAPTQQQAKSTAPEYLGRGNSDVTTAEAKHGSKLPHGPGTKKTTGKGKKRTTDANNQSNAKRRKDSDVSLGMSTTKAAAQTKKKNAGAKGTRSKTQAQGTSDSTEKDTKTSTRDKTIIASPNSTVFEATDNTISDQTKSVSVFAPATSMNQLGSTSQQTSLDAVKSSAGQSTTLYRGDQVATSEQPSVRFPQPWLSTTADSFVKARIFETSNRVTERTDEPGPSCTDASLHHLPQQLASNENRPHETWAPKSTRTEVIELPESEMSPRKATAETGEDFLGEDDDDMSEVIELMHGVETNGKAQCGTKSIPNNEDQLPTPVNSDPVTDTQFDRFQTGKRKRMPTPLLNPDEEFMDLDAEEEAEILDVAQAVEEAAIAKRPSISPPRNRKLNIRNVGPNDDYNGGLLSEAEQQLLDKLKTAAQDTNIKPIVRKPFPSSILDRSPLFGASNNTTLRTCFRVGEALNVGSDAVRMNKNMIVELYARVTSSNRQGRRQHFVFKDLYHDKPPYLEGSSELWQQSQLWDLDGKAFLAPQEGGIVCRVVGKMKREQSPMKLRLEVLNIFEAEWEDVAFVAGIYSRDLCQPSDDI